VPLADLLCHPVQYGVDHAFGLLGLNALDVRAQLSIDTASNRAAYK
jgi:hypothetical protein